MSNMDRPTPGATEFDATRDGEWQQIREALRGLRYGSVSIIVQDGVVIQIDRTEKRRLRRASSGAGSYS